MHEILLWDTLLCPIPMYQGYAGCHMPGFNCGRVHPPGAPGIEAGRVRRMHPAWRATIDCI